MKILLFLLVSTFITGIDFTEDPSYTTNDGGFSKDYAVFISDTASYDLGISWSWKNEIKYRIARIEAEAVIIDSAQKIWIYGNPRVVYLNDTVLYQSEREEK